MNDEWSTVSPSQPNQQLPFFWGVYACPSSTTMTEAYLWKSAFLTKVVESQTWRKTKTLKSLQSREEPNWQSSRICLKTDTSVVWSLVELYPQIPNPCNPHDRGLITHDSSDQLARLGLSLRTVSSFNVNKKVANLTTTKMSLKSWGCVIQY